MWKFFSERQIYRIDHYLGKDIVRHIYKTRFSEKTGLKIEQEKLKKVTVVALEKDEILKRGAYYDNFGALKDMFQSHILQILALALMRKPICEECDETIDGKVHLVSSLKVLKNKVVFGQYLGYKSELVSKKITNRYYGSC